MKKMPEFATKGMHHFIESFASIYFAKKFLCSSSQHLMLHKYCTLLFLGSAHGSHESKFFSLESTVTLRNGVNNISLLSVMVGLPVKIRPQFFH